MAPFSMTLIKSTKTGASSSKPLTNCNPVIATCKLCIIPTMAPLKKIITPGLELYALKCKRAAAVGVAQILQAQELPQWAQAAAVAAMRNPFYPSMPLPHRRQSPSELAARAAQAQITAQRAATRPLALWLLLRGAQVAVTSPGLQTTQPLTAVVLVAWEIGRAHV